MGPGVAQKIRIESLPTEILHFQINSKLNQIWFEPNVENEPNLIRSPIISINF